MADSNLMASDVLCLNETRISSLDANLDLCALLLNKFNALSCYDGHGTIMLYHTNMTLFKSCTFTHFGANFIMSSFNENTSRAMNIIATYKPPTMQLCHYLDILKNILKLIPIDCPTFLLGDVNVDMFVENLQSTTLKKFMLDYKLYLFFSESTTDYHSHLNHIWTNARTSQYASGTLEAYLTDHKRIYLNLKHSTF
jgi:hypothetical protein